MKNLVNKRHAKFKNELRAYHDSINRKNRYNLPKISGKLNVFEASDDGDDIKEKIETDRIIPNTSLSILVKDGMQAIGTRDGNPLTDFKYSFIEGSLGEKNKIIPCITDDGKIEYFDVNKEIITECDAGFGTANLTITDTSGGNANSKITNTGDYHEIEYDKVKNDLMIPYLSGYRIKDMRSGKLLNKGVKTRKRRK